MNDQVILYITAQSQEEANKITMQILEKELITCAKFIPFQNEGPSETKKNEEILILAKTSEMLLPKVKEEIESLAQCKTSYVLSPSSTVNESSR